MSHADQVPGSSGGLVVGIDATNLRQGGGRTHLIELLRAANPEAHGISRVVVWGSRATLALLDDRSWLAKVNPPAQEGGLLARSLWQRSHLSKAARESGCDVLFVPGGNYTGNFHPVVTMSQNMLPFEWRELRRYGWSWLSLKLVLLRLSQSRTFRLADGVIFLTTYANNSVQQVTGVLPNTALIPHGLNPRFVQTPRAQQSVEAFSPATPLRMLYVSIIDQYKHQWHVVEAVSNLRQRTGWSLALDLVGPAYPPALRRLQACIQRCDPGGSWVRYHGAVPFDQLHTLYGQADLGIFASSCENMPNILLETMAAGLPTACSNRGPMPEVLGDAGVYFEPEQPSDITRALRELIDSPQLRTEMAQASYQRARQFSWQHCADETFGFLAAVAQQQKRGA